MKIRLTFKTPDVTDQAFEDLDPCIVDDIRDSGVLSKFIKHGEYITIELDTVTLSAVVIPVNS